MWNDDSILECLCSSDIRGAVHTMNELLLSLSMDPHPPTSRLVSLFRVYGVLLGVSPNALHDNNINSDIKHAIHMLGQRYPPYLALISPQQQQPELTLIRIATLTARKHTVEAIHLAQHTLEHHNDNIHVHDDITINAIAQIHIINLLTVTQQQQQYQQQAVDILTRYRWNTTVLAHAVHTLYTQKLHNIAIHFIKHILQHYTHILNSTHANTILQAIACIEDFIPFDDWTLLVNEVTSFGKSYLVPLAKFVYESKKLHNTPPEMWSPSFIEILLTFFDSSNVAQVDEEKRERSHMSTWLSKVTRKHQLLFSRLTAAVGFFLDQSVDNLKIVEEVFEIRCDELADAVFEPLVSIAGALRSSVLLSDWKFLVASFNGWRNIYKKWFEEILLASRLYTHEKLSFLIYQSRHEEALDLLINYPLSTLFSASTNRLSDHLSAQTADHSEYHIDTVNSLLISAHELTSYNPNTIYKLTFRLSTFLARVILTDTDERESGFVLACHHHFKLCLDILVDACSQMCLNLSISTKETARSKMIFKTMDNFRRTLSLLPGANQEKIDSLVLEMEKTVKLHQMVSPLV